MRDEKMRDENLRTKNARRKMVVTRRVDVLKNFFNETSDKYSGILIKYSEWCVIEHLM